MFSADMSGNLSQKTSTLKTVARASSSIVQDKSITPTNTTAFNVSADDLSHTFEAQDPLFDAAYIQHLEDRSSPPNTLSEHATEDTATPVVPQVVPQVAPQVAPTAVSRLAPAGSVDQNGATDQDSATQVALRALDSAISFDSRREVETVPGYSNNYQTYQKARSLTQTGSVGVLAAFQAYQNAMGSDGVHGGATNAMSTTVAPMFPQLGTQSTMNAPTSANRLDGTIPFAQLGTQSTTDGHAHNYLTPAMNSSVPGYGIIDPFDLPQRTSMSDNTMSDNSWDSNGAGNPDAGNPLFDITYASAGVEDWRRLLAPPSSSQLLPNQLVQPQFNNDGQSTTTYPSQRFPNQEIQPQFIDNGQSTVAYSSQHFPNQVMQPRFINNGQSTVTYSSQHFPNQVMQPQFNNNGQLNATYSSQHFSNQVMQPQVNNGGQSTAIYPSHTPYPSHSTATYASPTAPFAGASGAGMSLGSSAAPPSTSTYSGAPAVPTSTSTSTSSGAPATPTSISASSGAPAAPPSMLTSSGAPATLTSTATSSGAPAAPPSMSTSSGSPAAPPSTSMPLDSAPTSTSLEHPGTAIVPAPMPLGDATQSDRSAANVTRSGRPVVPSKRAELSNKIGDNTKAVLPGPGKENIPPAGPPVWVVLAKDHLLARDLSGDWKECVEAWLELEEKLGYSDNRSTLPAVASRPEEWSKWVAKSRHGARRYDDIPFIADSAELGIVIVKWWHRMQPDFRQSADEMPAPVYVASDDSLWASIRKGGPSGLVSVLTMVVWWGQAVLDRNQYQLNSSSKWNDMVLDVKECIRAIVATTPSAPRKRKRTSGSENGAKHARI